MRGQTSTGQPWITKDECELYEYFGKKIIQVCHLGFCKYRTNLRDRKWGYCKKHEILIKLDHQIATTQETEK